MRVKCHVHEGLPSRRRFERGSLHVQKTTHYFTVRQSPSSMDVQGLKGWKISCGMYIWEVGGQSTPHPRVVRTTLGYYDWSDGIPPCLFEGPSALNLFRSWSQREQHGYICEACCLIETGARDGAAN